MKTVKLHNFQSHEDSVIKISETLTAITGESNKGKTSIVRGIKLVKDNVPAGDAFVRNGTKEMAVTIDGVSRIKNTQLNGYKIEGHQSPFKALRGNVPEEVTTALDMGPESIQDQHNAIFLLNLSSGKVAQRLSELSDLESTTRALKHIASKKANSNSDIKSLKNSIENTEDQLEELSNIPLMDKELTKIEQNSTAIDRLVTEYNELYTLHENAVTASSELNKLPNTKALKPAQQLITDFNEIQTLKSSRSVLKNALSTIAETEEVLKLDPTRLLNRAVRIQRLRKNADEIRTLVSTAKKLDTKMKSIELEHENLVALKVVLFGEECPLCGHSI